MSNQTNETNNPVVTDENNSATTNETINTMEIENDEATVEETIESSSTESINKEDNYSSTEDTQDETVNDTEAEATNEANKTESTTTEYGVGGFLTDIPTCAKVGIGLIGLATLGCVAYKMFEEEWIKIILEKIL